MLRVMVSLVRRRHSISTRVIAAAILLGSALGDGRPLLAQQAPGRYFLSVVDATGAPVADLQPSEIALKEDDTECASVKLEPIRWPMKLTVMVDNGPASAQSLSQLRSGLRGFFEEVPDGVELSLIAMAPQPRAVVRPTTEREKLTKGVDLIAPDQGAPRFFDAVVEAGSRIEKDKTDHFPVLMIVSTDGPEGSTPSDRDMQRLQKQIRQRAVTVHVLMLTLPKRGGNSRTAITGAIQLQVGNNLAEVSGGRYESVTAASKLVELLAGFARQIAKSQVRQSQQYRVSCEPQTAKAPQNVTVTKLRPGTSGTLTLDGHLP